LEAFCCSGHGAAVLLKGTNMTMKKVWSGMGFLAALLLILSMTLPAVVTAQVAAPAEDNSWKDVTLLYTSDIKGKIEPCG